MSWSPRSNNDPVVTLTCHSVKWSALLLFHHIPHINKTEGGWSGGRENEGRKATQKKEGRKEQIQIDRSVTGSVVVLLGGWMNVLDIHCRFRETISGNKRNWFRPKGKESMSEGHLNVLHLGGVVQSEEYSNVLLRKNKWNWIKNALTSMLMCSKTNPTILIPVFTLKQFCLMLLGLNLKAFSTFSLKKIVRGVSLHS